MTPDDVLDKLLKMGVKTSRSTLLRFEKANLIPTPMRGATGRGGGRYSDYPDDTPEHFFASWWVMKSERIPINELSKLLTIGRKINNPKLHHDNHTFLNEDQVKKLYGELFANDDKALQALIKFYCGGSDYGFNDFFSTGGILKDDFHRADQILRNFYNSQRKSYNGIESLFGLLDNDNYQMQNNDSDEIKASKIELLWQSYYERSQRSMIEITEELMNSDEVIKNLRNENNELKLEIMRLKKILNINPA